MYLAKFYFNFILLLIISILASPITEATAQDLQFDLSYGNHYGEPIISYNKYLKDYDNISSLKGFAYNIGITNKLKNKFYLRTQLGVLNNNGHLRIDFEKNVSLLPDTIVLSIGYATTWLYLSVLPEYRIQYKNFDFFINCGLTTAHEINRSFTDLSQDNDLNKVLILNTIRTKMYGVSSNLGLVYDFGSFGVLGSAGVASFTKTNIFSISRPTITYRYIDFKFGIVYNLK